MIPILVINEVYSRLDPVKYSIVKEAKGVIMKGVSFIAVTRVGEVELGNFGYHSDSFLVSGLL